MLRSIIYTLSSLTRVQFILVLLVILINDLLIFDLLITGTNMLALGEAGKWMVA